MVGPNTSVTQSEKRLLVAQALSLERHKTPRQFFLMFLKALGFSKWYMNSGLTLQSPEALAQEQCKPVLHRLTARQGGLFLCDICSARHSLPKKASFVAVKHLL
jgi:hypothetical protein